MVETKLLNYYTLVDNVKNTNREGWSKRGLRNESIASHSYGAQHIGCYLALKEGADFSRVSILLLFHDLIMSKIQDSTPEDASYAQKREMENAKMEQILTEVPDVMKRLYQGIVEEFNNGDTLEGQVAREADKLDTLFRAEAYETETERTDITGAFLKTYSHIFKTKSGMKILKEISKRELLRKNQTDPKY